MQDSIDQLYEFLESEKAEAVQKRKRAIREHDRSRAEYWQGYEDALATAADRLRPLAGLPVQPCLAAVPVDPKPVRELTETENLRTNALTPDEDPELQGHSLEVPLKPLMVALKRMTRFKRKRGSQELTSLSFRSGTLTISMLNVSERLSAEGVWASDILANSTILYAVAGVPPKEDPVIFRVVEGNLYIDTAFTPVELG